MMYEDVLGVSLLRWTGWHGKAPKEDDYLVAKKDLEVSE